MAWSHPKFGVLLASCSYDHTVLIHRETSPNVWARIHSHGEHSSSVNAIAWAPHEHGLALACASSDGNVSIISHQDDDKWRVDMVADSTLGVNAVSWAPYSHVGAAEPDGRVTRRLATGGCDNQVRVIKYAAADGAWRVEEVLRGGHSDWVRDVAWAPAGGMPHNTIASCSEDGFVVIWTQSAPRGEWVPYKLPKFDAPLWRLSWSITGNVLAVRACVCVCLCILGGGTTACGLLVFCSCLDAALCVFAWSDGCVCCLCWRCALARHTRASAVCVVLCWSFWCVDTGVCVCMSVFVSSVECACAHCMICVRAAGAVSCG